MRNEQVQPAADTPALWFDILAGRTPAAPLAMRWHTGTGTGVNGRCLVGVETAASHYEGARPTRIPRMNATRANTQLTGGMDGHLRLTLVQMCGTGIFRLTSNSRTQSLLTRQLSRDRSAQGQNMTGQDKTGQQ